ncbi:MAG: glycine/betaine ABC transporter substrate-binding protein [Geodermatophilaceae bacterium]|nr:glycine/betaine ABC transporter substrate-binding protein [Geodermatophilaceae bacterium]
MQRTMNGPRWVALVAVLALGVTACGGNDEASPGTGSEDAPSGGGELISDQFDLSGVEIRIGSKDFTEQLILGQLAKQALEAAGATVDLTENLPSPAGAREALLAGEVDAAWEYTGTAYINYLQHETPIDDPIEQYEAVRDEDLEQNGIFWTEPAPFDDTYGIATRRDFADENGLETLADVATFVEENPDEATLCLDSTFGSRDDGLIRFEDAYGVTWPEDQQTVQEFAIIYQATADGDPCNFGEVFTTDGRIQSLDLALMEDVESAFISYLSAVQINNDFNEANPDVAAVIELISAPLDEALMTALNAAVDVDGEFPEDAAAQYLQDQGFVE